ncbi:hypothetical protein C4D60_Mb02t20040 [Musa balbisiana]|uniref:Uncharacterized protein n=1 Tax=Musa balbisiana TaxID=52838 RepID=A0A4S8IDC7_MUSBA|nr:hypothetical protein C4D60_Mb02t20040 [Musa balbisiana]
MSRGRRRASDAILLLPLPFRWIDRSRGPVAPIFEYGEETVKKGDRCDPVTNNRCSGLQAKDGTQLLYCCKKHCRNVLSDRNNCGACGVRCGFGQLCCKGKCTAVAYDRTVMDFVTTHYPDTVEI